MHALGSLRAWLESPVLQHVPEHIQESGIKVYGEVRPKLRSGLGQKVFLDIQATGPLLLFSSAPMGYILLK